MKKKVKLIINTVVVALTLLVLKATALNVSAADYHEFILKAYNCNELDSSYNCVNDQGQIISNPTQITNGGDVNQGKVIRLDLYYIPGLHPDHTMRARIVYDNSKVDIIRRTTGTQKPYTKMYLINTDHGGMFPPDPDEEKETLFEISTGENVDQHRVTVTIEDGTHLTRITNQGTIISYYFRVKEAAVGDVAFTFQASNTELGSVDDELRLTPVTVNAYKELDSDTTLSNLTVTSGSTNYLLNFNSSTKSYDVYVPNNISSVTVTGTPNSGTTSAVNTPAGAQSLTVGTTKTVNILVTAESGDYDTYTVNIHRLNNVATLSSLTLSGIDFGEFSSGTTSYTASVPFSKSSTSVSATATPNIGATVVSGTGNKNLSVGSNTVSVKVNAENCGSAYSSVPGNTCTSNTYTVTVTREAASTNNYLSTLKVDNSNVPSWDKTYNGPYNVTINDGTKNTVNIAATVEDTGKATIKSGSKTGNQTISDGNNSFTITVVPESSTPERTYTVNVYRKSNSVALSNLTATSDPQGTLVNNGNGTYTYTVGPDVTAVAINATSANNATITGTRTYNPQTETSATIHVVSEDGNNETNYVVNLVRNKSSIATLDNLVVTGYSLSPSFSDDSKDYKVNVPYSVSSVSIVPTKTDSRATYVINNESSSLSVGDNNRNVVVTAEDQTTKKTYKLTVHRMNNDTTLSTLTVNGSQITGFAANKTSYNITVPYATDKVTIAATPHDTNGEVTGTVTNQSINVGENTITLTSKAEDRTITQLITITITRTAPSTNANLEYLNVDGVLIEDFSPDKILYNITRDSSKSSVNITAGKADPLAKSVSGTGSLGLNLGETSTTNIVVTAEDGTTTKTYTVNVYRLNNNNTLTNLVVEGFDLSPTFTDDTKSYEVRVPYSTTSVNIIPTKADNNAVATINNDGVTLNVGDNNRNISVLAEDTNLTARTYNLNIRRLNNDVTLSSLTFNGASISGFAADKTSYSITVPYTTDKVTIAAQTHDTNASVTGGVTNQSIDVGQTEFTLNVTAEDTGITQPITIIVNRVAASSDAYLTDLTIDNTTVNDFSETTYSYNVTVGSTVSSINISATANVGSTIASTSDIGEKSLTVGVNDFEIVVVAQNGETRVPYYLHVTKLNGANELTGLTVTSNPQGEMNPTSFNSGTKLYTYTVGPDVNAVTINATGPSGSSVTYSPTKTNNVYDPNETSSVTITVAPEDPNAESTTYTINLVRTESSINTLDGIKVNNNDVPGFDPDTTSYTVNVPYTETTATITATPTDGDRESYTVSGPSTLAVGDNEFTISVEAEDGTPNTYTVIVHRKNNDNTLSSLTLSNASLNEDFDSSETSYTATVPYTTTTTTVNAIATDTSLTPVITGNSALSVGENAYTIVVTPEDENEPSKTYTVVVTRQAPSSDAYLTDLTIDNVTVQNFSGQETYEYTVEVSNSTSLVNIGAVANTGSTVSSDSDIGSKSLSVGMNDFEIVAVAQNGETRVSYMLHIKRLDSNNNLGSLTITSDPQGTLDNSFDPGTTEYTYTVGPNAGDISVVATPEGNATVTISPDSASGTYDPDETNTITITVVPEEGDPKTYTINIVRQKSTDNTLSSLGVAGYQITPDFSNDVPSYTLTVGKEIDKATIIAEKGESHQTIDGLGEKPLNKGENPFTITVHPEDNTALDRVFTITITREKSSIKTLDDLKVDGVTIDGFAVDNPNYDLGTVSDDTSSINISATPTDPSSNVGGTGDIALEPGSNTIPITVTPEDGSEPMTYTITVYRALNTNNYLASLTVNGVSVPSFDKETLNYSVNVPIDSTTVDIDGTPEVTTSVVVGTGDAIGLNNTDEPTVITISVIPQSGEGNARNYTVTVTKVDDAEFITSIAYGHVIEDGMIKTVTPETTPNGLKDQLDNDNAKLFIYNADGETVISDDAFVGTGSVVKLINNGTLKDSKLALIIGDVNGDGKITLFDAICIFSHLLETEPLTGINAIAADVDNSGTITLFDAISIFSILLE